MFKRVLLAAVLIAQSSAFAVKTSEMTEGKAIEHYQGKKKAFTQDGGMTVLAPKSIAAILINNEKAKPHILAYKRKNSAAMAFLVPGLVIELGGCTVMLFVHMGYGLLTVLGGFAIAVPGIVFAGSAGNDLAAGVDAYNSTVSYGEPIRIDPLAQDAWISRSRLAASSQGPALRLAHTFEF